MYIIQLHLWYRHWLPHTLSAFKIFYAGASLLHGLFSSYSESGLGSSVVVMCRLLIVAAFLVVEHRL